VQLESVSFFFGESGAFVEQRIVQKLVTVEIGFNERAVARVLTSVQHCGYAFVICFEFVMVMPHITV